MKIRDRVREFRRVPASQLRPSPKNWRSHSPAQADALRGVLAEIGFAGAVIARELQDGTLELIDGHLRVETVPDSEIPVLVLDVNEQEAALLLATFDPIGAMAGADADKLDSLLSEVSPSNAAVTELLDSLAHQHGLGEPTAPEPEQPAGTDEIPERYQILVEFNTEQDQAAWLEKLTAEGLKCRSLIS
jgi:ParB-like nuclease domain